MSKTGKAEYGQGNGYQAVRLPYGSGETAMYCILPKEGQTIHDFIATLDTGRWWEIRESIAERDEVILQLPRFQLEYGIKNLNESLTALGMEEAFTEQADFGGIRDDVFIGRVLHKAVIEVNEEGSEAAAATAVEMKCTGIAEPLAFIADRPFLFVIVDDKTGTILFLGKVYEVNEGGEVGIRTNTASGDEERVIEIEPDFAREISAKSLNIVVPEDDKIKNPTEGLLQTALEITPANGAFQLDFSLQNMAGRSLPLYFSSSQKFDYLVTGQNGQEIYRWSRDKCFATAIVEVCLKKGEKLSFTEIWSGEDNEGNKIPPGKYTVTVKITAKLKERGSIAPDELTAKQDIQVKDCGF